MNIVKTVKSWDKTKNKDCFGYGNKSNIDHIYPISKGGSDSLKNKQRLSTEANEAKQNKTKGKIDNTWSFSIMRQIDKNELVYGVMFIRNKKWPINQWYKVEPATE